MRSLIRNSLVAVVSLACAQARPRVAAPAGAALAAAPRFEVSFPASAHAAPITGRVVISIARSARPVPRLAISPRGAAIFGVDLDQLAPGASAVVDDAALGCR